MGRCYASAVGYLSLAVASTAAGGLARLIDGPTPPSPGPSLSIDPLIVVAAVAMVIAIVAARWGVTFTHRAE
jgi:hypothetical protein